MKDVKVASVAFRSEFGEPQTNCESMLACIAEAAGAGAAWVCFPEVALQGYHSDVDRMQREAEPLDGAYLTRLRHAAAHHAVTLSVGLALRLPTEPPGDGRVLNSVLHIGPDGKLRGEPRCSGKVHAEKDMFAMPRPDESWPVVDLGFAKVGTVICFDAEFPEAGRSLALGGADVIFMSFATGRCDSKGNQASAVGFDWATDVLRWAPAIAYMNRCYCVASNHAGDVADPQGIASIESCRPPLLKGDVHTWPGFCFCLNPDGEIVAESPRGSHQQSILYCKLDGSAVNTFRAAKHWGNMLAHRRPETYGRLTLLHPTAAAASATTTTTAGGIGGLAARRHTARL